ncbi:hypothetical protein BOTBODRAFT_31400 [Botryobasidium botryosum FD-172 SS1]|uniref:Uncharacterized protein n=1 Tax=Botryobasidium botryosum (strain FD-172 SS1) TaxID=930990 RepID=A0A067MJK7_BOTB1|nr:hypothetical protein BOTBODRAFT_31400 [Botryobasidium botryosum FD-172 SS1]
MKLSIAAIAALLAPAVLAQTPLTDPSINTPVDVVECQPTDLTFGGTAPPFIISIIPGGQAGAAPLETLGTSSGPSLTWVANITAGTKVTFEIRDAQGRLGFSAIVTIQAGTSTACVGK